MREMGGGVKRDEGRDEGRRGECDERRAEECG